MAEAELPESLFLPLPVNMFTGLEIAVKIKIYHMYTCAKQQADKVSVLC